MAGHLVTADLGNSRLKLRAWHADAVVVARDLAHADIDARLARELDACEPIEALAFASVASRDVEERVLFALRRRFGPRARAALPYGLELDVRSPERLGADRAFAARGAFELLHASALVVDAGTCVTVDALSVDERARARFLGGAIAPGPTLLRDALARGGARLFAVEPSADAPALGRDTDEALRAGIVVGLRGAVRELVDAVAREARLEDATVVVTGGAAELLDLARIAGARRWRHVPDLVHVGLLAALRETLRSGA